MSQETGRSSAVLQGLPDMIRLAKAVFGEAALEERVRSKSEKLRFIRALESVSGPNDLVSLGSAVALFKLLKIASAPKQIQVLTAYEDPKAPDVVLTTDQFLRLLYLLAASN